MSTYVKGNITIVVENISHIQENVEGKNYVTLCNGMSIEISSSELAKLKALM